VANPQAAHDDSVTVAVIGAGNIARRAHLPAWNAQDIARVAMVVDARRDAAEAVAAEFGIPRTGSDVREALDDPTIDAVDICLPHHLHATVALSALAAGKHVLLEKPLAIDVPSARQVVAAARIAAARGTVFMAAENWRYAPVAVEAADVLRSGALGEPFLLRSSLEMQLALAEDAWRARRDLSGGGVLIDSGIHAVSVARLLMGEVAGVVALRGKQLLPALAPSEDTIALLTRFADDSCGVLDFTWCSPRRQACYAFEVFATEGSLRFDIVTGSLMVSRGQEHEPRTLVRSNGVCEEIRHFAECVRDGRQPRTTADVEAGSLAVVLAAYASLETATLTVPEDLV
jgi:predicted dehydrogenase